MLKRLKFADLATLEQQGGWIRVQPPCFLAEIAVSDIDYENAIKGNYAIRIQQAQVYST